MPNVVPVGVVVPTYDRGLAVLSTLGRIYACDPRPTEMFVHVDAADGILEGELARRFPEVSVLTSQTRLGPGGGRHRCLLACKVPYAVSFDDDSYPVDVDFFSQVVNLFSTHPRAAIFAANIWHRGAAPIAITDCLIRTSIFTGCGYAIRLSAYREVRGYLPRPVAYGMEETDLSLQLFAAGWEIYDAGRLRVFHDTELAHHNSPEIVSGYVANVGLYAFLHYPISGWYRGFLQVANVVVFSVRMGRIRGLCSGLVRIPLDCYRNRLHRNPIAWQTVRRFLQFRKTGVAS